MLGNLGFRHDDVQEPSILEHKKGSLPLPPPHTAPLLTAVALAKCKKNPAREHEHFRCRRICIYLASRIVVWCGVTLCFDVPICNPEILFLGRKEFQTSMAVLGYTGNTNKLWVPCPKSYPRQRTPGGHKAKKHPTFPEFQPQEQIYSLLVATVHYVSLLYA